MNQNIDGNICLNNGGVMEVGNMSVCTNCMDYVTYTTKVVRETVKHADGNYYTYDKKYTFCNKCGERILVHSIMDENINKLKKVIKEDNGLVSIEQVEKIIDMYGIGKRSLSVLLGFGEQTLTRYLDNEIPLDVYSNILLEVLDDYNKMLEIANKNKDKVSENVYNKFLRAIDVLKQKENMEKVVLDSKYILLKEQDITNLSVQKLLYFSQIVALANSNNLLFEDVPDAMNYGPVYRKVHNRLKKYSWDLIDKEEFLNGEDIQIDEESKEVIDAVLKTFGRYSGHVLSTLSHMTDPWKKAEKNKSKTISNEDIKEYALKIREKFYDKANNIEELCEMYLESFYK